MGSEGKGYQKVSRAYRFDRGSGRGDIAAEWIHRFLGSCDGESSQDPGPVVGAKQI